jgi:hypothetical protein
MKRVAWQAKKWLGIIPAYLLFNSLRRGISCIKGAQVVDQKFSTAILPLYQQLYFKVLFSHIVMFRYATTLLIRGTE